MTKTKCTFPISHQLLADLADASDFGFYDGVADAIASGFPLSLLDIVSELDDATQTDDRMPEHDGWAS